ncbi:glycosyltransferase [Pseudosulfitobacter pseudonitzschiae]|uniref:glycosyltransferase n=1 Tax=Pseudosulfitobacter pseudonitzschiae TaxID=1402135 RepID=UPI001AF4ACAA|nr:glycosyltransferase [Pseudosulfitobacter pseudonitzschiae]MBM1817359.1 glycosyltransferase [Pseudosulfitobacter pseudonitzschiae]MBM1834557.1 glycosyltransferase [Pseudosulfitobacter pseudonitzschiae]MBM1839422.1 glycosyltransferase [Pseudosulfitobacter pseudonitzschiae]MBM1844272.1 glycosyltransferase [Pseudosulfitobacter pseudonitzschiae]MBM1849107.1 glycosyltransferase [Pseudosulfitobacter pseudonitzschiae]
MSNATATPLISVVSITLNDRDGLWRTVESLQSQTDAPSYEHIVVDGVSDYDVAGLLAEMGSTAQLHQGSDKGLYDAMNIGTGLAHGGYLIYLNSGDTLAGPEVLSEVGTVLTSERPDFLYGDSLERQLDGEDVFKIAHSHNSAPVRMFTHHQSMIFRRAIVSDAGLRYDLAYPIAADYDFTLRFLKQANRIVRFPGVIANFSAGGVSQVKHHVGRREQFVVRRQHFGNTGFALRVYLMQVFGHFMRAFSPKLYWRLRAFAGKRS